MKTRWLLVLLSAWLLIPSEPVEAALADEAGTPLITNYSFRDYDEHPQNWAITQDHRGVMYFGNTNGVMEYDGTTWSSIPVANGSIARSLATDRNGRVYVGAIGEIGYLETDAAGELTYRSLRHRLPPEAQDFADVWRTFATDDGIFFWSYAGF
ncbi:MAG: hybrid sensor histidine kinase/response regulator, partial [Acidobacteriota bacterium]